MGLQQSKDELLYQQVSNGNTEGVRKLRSEGAGLENLFLVVKLVDQFVLFRFKKVYGLLLVL
ncbi:hypothetical protein HanOQP8_Chr13g0502151 [Helianthus annuus]|nr:hypothetical protein HanOQP8_Chr13g0502151 [Helianthus annuus]